MDAIYILYSFFIYSPEHNAITKFILSNYNLSSFLSGAF